VPLAHNAVVHHLPETMNTGFPDILLPRPEPIYYFRRALRLSRFQYFSRGKLPLLRDQAAQQCAFWRRPDDLKSVC
jgi:hypothetical protein